MDAAHQVNAIARGEQQEFSVGRMLFAGAIGGATNAVFARTCFTGETKIYARGPRGEGWRRIDEITILDEVLSRDENDPFGPLVWKRVEEVFTSFAFVDNLRIGGKVIGTTSEHPFYVVEKGWTAASVLRMGDRIPGMDASQSTPVEGLAPSGEFRKVYNLRIADFHTYFVGDESWEFSVWAHNLYGGDHHMIPRALGSRVPYGHRILTPLNAAEHTHLHRALNDFLRLRTRTLSTGQVVDMFARAGNSGRLVRRTFSQAERLNALDMFYRNYRGGMYYGAFNAERAYTLAVPGRFI